ncbi:hypothetical protein ACP4OV_002118 [Aristida adscensionis]
MDLGRFRVVGLALDLAEIRLHSDGSAEDGGDGVVGKKVVYPSAEKLWSEILNGLGRFVSCFDVDCDEEKRTRVRLIIRHSESSSSLNSSGSEVIDSGYLSDVEKAMDFVVREGVAWLQAKEGVEIIDSIWRRKELEDVCAQMYVRSERLMSACNFFISSWEHVGLELNDLCCVWGVHINKRRCRDMTLVIGRDLQCDTLGRLTYVFDKYQKQQQMVRKSMETVNDYKEMYASVSINNLVRNAKDWKRQVDISGSYMLQELLSSVHGAEWKTECLKALGGKFSATVKIYFTEGSIYFRGNELEVEGEEMMSEIAATEDAARKAVRFLEDRMLFYVQDINHGIRVFAELQVGYLSRLQQRIIEIIEEARDGWNVMVKEMQCIQHVYAWSVNILRRSTDNERGQALVQQCKDRLEDVLFHSSVALGPAEAVVNGALQC